MASKSLKTIAGKLNLKNRENGKSEVFSPRPYGHFLTGQNEARDSAGTSQELGVQKMREALHYGMPLGRTDSK